MQKIKTIQVGNKSFTLKELHTRHVWGLINSESQQPMLERFQELLKLGCPELDKEALLDLYPSEIEELWRGFEEVNASFLGLVRQLGMDQALIGTVRVAVLSSTEQFATLLHPVTVQ